MYSASNNFLKGNVAVFNANMGIYIIMNSANNILRNNSMSNSGSMFGDGYNFYIRSFDWSAFGNDIDTTNTVEGKPIYYIENVNNKTYENLGDVGVFYCVKCNNITFKNFAINSLNNETALILWQTNNSYIEDLNIDKSGVGIRIRYSYNNILKNNTINNTLAGVLISRASSGNLFYHNNFINNRQHLWFVESGTNSFNADLPLGGNYWDNFNEPAEGCEDLNNDGFCDSPYVFSGGQDNYPWIKQDGWITKTLSEQASELTKELIYQPYLWGGKGWDYNQNLFVSADAVKAGYNFWNQAIKSVDLGVGIDCSGLIMWAYDRSFDPNKSRFNNFVKAEGADEQYRYNTQSTTESQLQPGDAMFFDNVDRNGNPGQDGHIDHVEMYVGKSGGFDVVSAASKDLGIIGRLKDIRKQPQTGFVAFKRVVSALPPAVLATAHSPIDLVVTDPDGFTITSTTTFPSDLEFLREIPGVLYYSEMERGADGKPIDQVYSYIAKAGDYTIQVLPEFNTPSTATYTLDFSVAGQSIVLAEDAPISQIPSQGYGITTSETGIINSFIPVSIDIKPGSYPNSINLGSNGVIPVAIFGSSTFNVRQIDTTTLKLGNASAKIKGNSQLAISYSDINNDGFIDIVVKVSTEALQLTKNDIKTNLEGRLVDGAIIKGSDSVRIVPQKN